MQAQFIFGLICFNLGLCAAVSVALVLAYQEYRDRKENQSIRQPRLMARYNG